MRISISVVIPVHRGGPEFRRCIDAILRSSRRPEEFIVVADGPTDGAWEMAGDSGATTVLNPVALGPAVARNQGAREAHGDVLFFVDADVEIRADTIERVAAFFEQHEDVDALIGSYDDSPSETGLISSYRNLLHHFTHQTALPEASSFWGACGAIRRTVFLDSGGFSEEFGQPSIEDIELGYRLRDAGYRIRLDPTLQVKHLKKWTPMLMVRTDFFQRALPWTELILSRTTKERDLNLSISNRYSVALVATAVLLVAAWAIATALSPTGAVPHGVMSAVIVSEFGLFLALNARFYRFLVRTRGILFMLACLPWHVLFYAYSGLAYGIGIVRHGLDRKHS